MTTASDQLDPIISFGASILVLAGVAVIGKGVTEATFHQSIPWEDEKRLTESYGKWAVKRAIAFCPHNDVVCVEREASRLVETVKRRV